jgi:acetyltransferase-like isoleucine patch superfamily enzyme
MPRRAPDLLTPTLHAAAVLRTIAYLRMRGVKHGRLPCMRRRLPRLVADGRIVIGDRLYAHGVRFRAALEAYPGATLRIGDNVRLGNGASVLAYRLIEIGDDCRLTELSQVIDSNVHEVEEGAGVRTAAVQLGRNVWLGRASIVLPGVTIGDHTVIGSNSVVSESLPSRVIAAGVPARPLRELSMRDDWRRR